MSPMIITIILAVSTLNYIFSMMVETIDAKTMTRAASMFGFGMLVGQLIK